jgi:diadenosine tetraphosphatase ApaH/serine/threonine PP2A family protein phosphatase
MPVIVGNHELAVFNRQHLDWFNPMARNSVEKSIAMLSDASMEFIRLLPRSYVGDNFRCVHGYPPDSARTYLFQKMPAHLIKTFNEMAEPICFVGHTHDLEIVDFDGRQVERHPLAQGHTALDPKRSYIVNVGSVGQPRDGNNNAKYVIFDSDRLGIEVRFVPYDIAAVVEKIKSAGLPEVHGRRLW